MNLPVSVQGNMFDRVHLRWVQLNPLQNATP
jgi:hypothetical protein